MAQRDCAAVDVDDIHVEAQLVVDNISLRRKRLVGLDQVEVSNGQAGALQCLAGGLDRADAHDGRIAADRAKRTDLGQRLEAVRLNEVLRRDDHGSASVVDAGSVACGDRAVLLERRAELCQNFEGRVRAAVLVGVKNNSLLLLLDLDRNDLVLEAARGNRLASLLLGSASQLILHLAGNAVLLCDVLCGDAHVILVEHIEHAVVNHHIDKLHIVHTGAPAHIAGDVRCAGHGLAAADQHHLILTGADDLGTQRDRAHRGSADLVEGHSGGLDRHTDAEGYLAGHVLANAALQNLTEQALVDRSLVNACALNGSVCSSNAKLGSGYVAEGAAIGADCGTGSGTDVNVHLLFLLFFWCTGPAGAVWKLVCGFVNILSNVREFASGFCELCQVVNKLFTTCKTHTRNKTEISRWPGP